MLTRKQLAAWNRAVVRRLKRATKDSPAGLMVTAPILNGDAYEAAKAAGKPLTGAETATWSMTPDEIAELDASPSRKFH
jgi:hypothetical protein